MEKIIDKITEHRKRDDIENFIIKQRYYPISHNINQSRKQNERKIMQSINAMVEIKPFFLAMKDPKPKSKNWHIQENRFGKMMHEGFK